MYYPALLC